MPHPSACPRLVRALALGLGVWATWVGFLPDEVKAQSCHAPLLRPVSESGLRSEASAFVAGYNQGQDSGHYEGGSLTLLLAHARIGADVTVPFYGLTRGETREHGLGDVLAGLRAPVYRLREGERERFAIGPELAASFPSGDRAAGLGMGHVMLMPGLFARLLGERLTVVAQLAYGFGVGHGQHHHTAGNDTSVQDHQHHSSEEHAAWMAQLTDSSHDDVATGPIVHPMNQSELEHVLSAAFQWTPLFALTARLAGAVPIADDDGEVREIGSAGVRFTLGAFDLGLEEELPLIGDPIQHRTVLRVGGQW